ncbi:sialate O-acetylesterase [uncultured Bacteroides sp.]|mgnify:CR=1 FL=1|uniref:sialate O-acetylesterase n=1 Tax=uncultured Bacteroides sp. TaxID=162156 RepID=UPI00262DA1BA|nr:sialate O-acetylesterase [uncultured Bacteroides sp.]
MKVFYKFLFVLFLCLVSSDYIFSKKIVDVYIIGGQSNAVGIGIVDNIPRTFNIDKSVMFYYSKYHNNGKGSEFWHELSPASVKEEWFGVELSFGTSLKRYFPDSNIALIKHASSGTNLYEQWNPGNRKGEKQGEEYIKFINTIKASLKQLEDKGYSPMIKAMVWQQGEADAREIAGMENSRKYGENLRNFIYQIRKELNSPNMLFIYGEVMPMEAERFPGRNLVRAAQYNVSEGACSPLSVENAILVEGDDLQMIRSDYKTSLPNDDVHLGTYGLLTLGERFAKVVFDNIGNK